MTKAQYGEAIGARLTELNARLREGRWRHQPILRVNIPKGRGKTRPIGISCVEDKLVQGLAEFYGAVHEPMFRPSAFLDEASFVAEFECLGISLSAGGPCVTTRFDGSGTLRQSSPAAPPGDTYVVGSGRLCEPSCPSGQQCLPFGVSGAPCCGALCFEGCGGCIQRTTPVARSTTGGGSVAGARAAGLAVTEPEYALVVVGGRLALGANDGSWGAPAVDNRGTAGLSYRGRAVGGEPMFLRSRPRWPSRPPSLRPRASISRAQCSLPANRMAPSPGSRATRSVRPTGPTMAPSLRFSSGCPESGRPSAVRGPHSAGGDGPVAGVERHSDSSLGAERLLA